MGGEMRSYPPASPPRGKGPGLVFPGAPCPPVMVKPGLREEMVLGGQPEEAWGGTGARPWARGLL